MVDIRAYARRVRRNTLIASMLFVVGAVITAGVFLSRLPIFAKGEAALVGLVIMGVSAYFWFRAMELPTREIMQLAADRRGLLTVTEITTALNADPDRVMRALRYLRDRGLARVSWQDLDKNLWEFPDCLQLPVPEAIAMAQANGGRLSLRDLLARGHTMEIAQQTMHTLAEKGLAKAEQGGDEGESDNPRMVIRN